MEEAITLAEKIEEVESFIIGGAELINQTLEIADKIYLTEIDAEVEGDTFLNSFDLEKWEAKDRKDFLRTGKGNDFDFSIIEYHKKKTDEAQPIPKNILWKGIIEDFFESFILFFYPEFETSFDFAKGYEFLDKELDQLFPENSNSRHVDKLVKVFLQDGNPQWILIHIEVQGYKDINFAKRMFTYYYRIYDRYQIPIEAIAIFTDSHKNYSPSTYSTTCLKTKLDYQYYTYKLIDQKEEELEKSTNIFGIVMLAASIAFNKQKTQDEKLLELKLNLFRKLLNRGYSREVIHKLVTFLKHYVSFDDRSFNIKFDKEIDLISETSNDMGINERVLAYVEKKGEERGQILTIKKLLETKLLSPSQIADSLNVPLEFVLKLNKEIE
jgi:hypothetical protein